LKAGEQSYYFKARGTAYYELEEYDKAIEDFNRAIELSPYYQSALSWRGRAYNDSGKEQEALADYNLAAKLMPYDYEPADTDRWSPRPGVPHVATKWKSDEPGSKHHQLSELRCRDRCQ
jgi:tetratricopeptide (TPR) repeat protein